MRSPCEGTFCAAKISNILPTSARPQRAREDCRTPNRTHWKRTSLRLALGPIEAILDNRLVQVVGRPKVLPAWSPLKNYRTAKLRFSRGA